MNSVAKLLQIDHLRSRSGLQAFPQLGLAVIAGILLGFGVLTFGPTNALGAIAGIILLVLTFTNPEITILVMLGFTAGLIPAHLNLSVNVMAGHLQITDLLLILLLSVIAFRWLTDKTYRLVKTPLDLPLLCFAAAVFIAVGTAVLTKGVQFKDATYEARILLYYLVFFAVTNLIRTRAQLIRLFAGVFAIGLAVTGILLAQAVLGRSVYLVDPAYVQGADLTRVYHPGYIVAYPVLMVLICDLAFSKERRTRLVTIPPILLLGLSLLTSLGRNVLIATAISLPALIVVLRRRQLSRLSLNLLLIAIIAIGVFAGLTAAGSESRLLKYPAVMTDRLSRMFSGTILASNETLVPRWQEIQYAWSQILQSPIVGIGVQTPYRPAFYKGDTLTRYIHMAYLWVWLKTGLLGLVPFLWFATAGLVRGFRHWREAPDSLLRAVTLGVALTYLAMMISNLVAPSFVGSFNLMIYGVMLGVNEVVFAQSAGSQDSEERR